MQSSVLTVAILAYDGIEPIDIGATYGVLSMAKRLAPGLQFFVVSKLGGELAMANGLRLVADYSFADCPGADVLMVLGGPGWQAACRDQSLLQFVNSFHRSKATVAGVHGRHDLGCCRFARWPNSDNQARGCARRDSAIGCAFATAP